MGATMSRAEAAPAAPPPGFMPSVAAAAAVSAGDRVTVTDYMKLPQPVRFEELQREIMISLKPDCFEGFRFDMTKPLNGNFALSHSVFLGNVEVPAQGGQAVKVSVGTYEFGANLATEGGTLVLGRIGADGRLNGRVRAELSSFAAAKAQFQLVNEPGGSQGMLDLDLKGGDWNGQLKLGTGGFYGLNYLQSVTPRLALGAEAFFLSEQGRSGAGLVARHAARDGSVATAQLANTGLVNLAYVRKAGDKCTLGSEFTWNLNTREATAAFGYDYAFRAARMRGKIDSDGKIQALLEERINPAVAFILSAELDHARKDYKFGFGMTIGE